MTDVAVFDHVIKTILGFPGDRITRNPIFCFPNYPGLRDTGSIYGTRVSADK